MGQKMQQKYANCEGNLVRTKSSTTYLLITTPILGSLSSQPPTLQDLRLHSHTPPDFQTLFCLLVAAAAGFLMRKPAFGGQSLDIIHYTLYFIHYTLFSIHYILYITPYILYIIAYTLSLYIIQYTLYIIHYTLYLIHYTLYIIQYTLYI